MSMRLLAELKRVGSLPGLVAIHIDPEDKAVQITVRSAPVKSSFAKGAMVCGQEGVINLSIHEFGAVLRAVSDGMRELGV